MIRPPFTPSILSQVDGAENLEMSGAGIMTRVRDNGFGTSKHIVSLYAIRAIRDRKTTSGQIEQQMVAGGLIEPTEPALTPMQRMRDRFFDFMGQVDRDDICVEFIKELRKRMQEAGRF